MEPKSASAFAPWRSNGRSRRNFRRWDVYVEATFHTTKRSFACILHDISPVGAQIEVLGRTRVKPGSKTQLELAGYGRLPARVRRVTGSTLGLEFAHDDAHAAGLARYLISQRPPRQQRRREVDAGASLLVRGERMPCRLRDVSRFGARVVADDAGAFSEEQEILLRIDGHNSLPAIIRRVDGNEIGLVLIEEYGGRLLVDAS